MTPRQRKRRKLRAKGKTTPPSRPKKGSNGRLYSKAADTARKNAAPLSGGYGRYW